MNHTPASQVSPNARTAAITLIQITITLPLCFYFTFSAISSMRMPRLPLNSAMSPGRSQLSSSAVSADLSVE